MELGTQEQVEVSEMTAKLPPSPGSSAREGHYSHNVQENVKHCLAE